MERNKLKVNASQQKYSNALFLYELFLYEFTTDKKRFKYSGGIGTLKEKMTKFSKVTDDEDKNDHQNKSTVLKGPILDTCVDVTEFFLRSNTTDRQKSLKTSRK